MAEVNAFILKEVEKTKKEVFRMLSFLGEKCVIEIRDRSFAESWIDQTGNLRSSTGYVVVMDGKIMSMSNFEQVKEGSEGVLIGKDLAEKLAKEIKAKYALIVVAGMEYAVYVESLENKVVLASAELLARQQLPIMVKQLERKLARQ